MLCCSLQGNLKAFFTWCLISFVDLILVCFSLRKSCILCFGNQRWRSGYIPILLRLIAIDSCAASLWASPRLDLQYSYKFSKVIAKVNHTTIIIAHRLHERYKQYDFFLPIQWNLLFCVCVMSVANQESWIAFSRYGILKKMLKQVRTNVQLYSSFCPVSEIAPFCSSILFLFPGKITKDEIHFHQHFSAQMLIFSLCKYLRALALHCGIVSLIHFENTAMDSLF